MNTSPENDPAKLAKDKLGQACRALDKVARLRWTMLIVQLILVAILVLALMDYWLVLPLWLRTGGALSLLLLLLAGLVRLVRFCLRPTPLKQGALAIESQRPELGCEVSTAAEYVAGERKIEHEYEPELAAALEAKAAKALGAAPVPVCGRLIKFALLLGASCFALIVLVLVAPGGLTALERTAVPFSSAHYTAVDVRPGDFEIPVGHNAEVTNVFSGRLPRDARISWAAKDALRWQTAALTGGTQGTYLHTWSNVQSDLVYRVAGSDARSRDFTVSTYVPPTVQDFNVSLKYPEYIRLAPMLQKSPNISAVRATTAEIRIQPSVQLKAANLHITKLPDVALTPNADGSWSGTISITNDTDYFIQLAEVIGVVRD